MHHTAGHAEINAFGDIGLCIPIQKASHVYKPGTYQAQHVMMPQTHYTFQTESNRAMTDGVLFLQSLKCVGFTPPLIKCCSMKKIQNRKQNTNARAKAEN